MAAKKQQTIHPFQRTIMRIKGGQSKRRVSTLLFHCGRIKDGGFAAQRNHYVFGRTSDQLSIDPKKLRLYLRYRSFNRCLGGSLARVLLGRRRPHLTEVSYRG